MKAVNLLYFIFITSSIFLTIFNFGKVIKKRE